MTKAQKKTIYGLLRELLGIRDQERCLRCGATERLQMSHIYPKGTHRRMEFDPENIKLLCWRCHFTFWHKSPIEAWDWLSKTIPKSRLDRLRLAAASVNKSPFDPKLYTLWLKLEIKKLTHVPVVSQSCSPTGSRKKS